MAILGETVSVASVRLMAIHSLLFISATLLVVLWICFYYQRKCGYLLALNIFNGTGIACLYFTVHAFPMYVYWFLNVLFYGGLIFLLIVDYHYRRICYCTGCLLRMQYEFATRRRTNNWPWTRFTLFGATAHVVPVPSTDTTSIPLTSHFRSDSTTTSDLEMGSSSRTNFNSSTSTQDTRPFGRQMTRKWRSEGERATRMKLIVRGIYNPGSIPIPVRNTFEKEATLVDIARYSRKTTSAPNLGYCSSSSSDTEFFSTVKAEVYQSDAQESMNPPSTSAPRSFVHFQDDTDSDKVLKKTPASTNVKDLDRIDVASSTSDDSIFDFQRRGGGDAGVFFRVGNGSEHSYDSDISGSSTSTDRTVIDEIKRHQSDQGDRG